MARFCLDFMVFSVPRECVSLIYYGIDYYFLVVLLDGAAFDTS